MKETKTKKLHPLRIDSRTVIYVTKDKANEKYAKEYKARLEECKSVLSDNRRNKTKND